MARDLALVWLAGLLVVEACATAEAKEPGGAAVACPARVLGAQELATAAGGLKDVVAAQSFEVGSAADRFTFTIARPLIGTGKAARRTLQASIARPGRERVLVDLDAGWNTQAVVGVMFRDLSGAGRCDVIVLSREGAPAPHDVAPFNLAQVLVQSRDGRFESSASADDAANAPSASPTLKEVARRLAQRGTISPPTTIRAAVSQVDANRWTYRMTGQDSDGRTLACSAPATLSRLPDHGGRTCLGWSMGKPPTCVGQLALDWLNTEADDSSKRPAHFRTDERGQVGGRICNNGGAWEMDAVPPGTGNCIFEVDAPAVGTPNSIHVECPWQCREPSTCSGDTTYSFDPR